jgi:hypothetical protein
MWELMLLLQPSRLQGFMLCVELLASNLILLLLRRRPNPLVVLLLLLLLHYLKQCHVGIVVFLGALRQFTSSSSSSTWACCLCSYINLVCTPQLLLLLLAMMWPNVHLHVIHITNQPPLIFSNTCTNPLLLLLDGRSWAGIHSIKVSAVLLLLLMVVVV